MSHFINNRKALIALAIAVALVAIVVPTCRMVGCSMENGYMGFMHAGSDLGFFGSCGGEYTSTSGPEGLIPPSSQSLLLSMVAALAAVALVFRPQLVSRPVYLADATPPPPPEDPLGARFRV